MPQFICFLEPTRAEMPDNPTEQESKAVKAHFEYYQRLQKRGALILAGRTQEPPHIGILVFNAPTKDDAISIAAQDPAIIQGVFLCRVQSYQVALSQ
ncbi:MAG: YciI family protein [Phycisphaerales bacterium]|jgi:uncharacterized protein YciI|nr:YciI family protein [Phycisphaerales bacterium]